jgi:hypothetical protein
MNRGNWGGFLNAKSSEDGVACKRLNSTGTLIQRATTEAAQGPDFAGDWSRFETTMACLPQAAS